MPTTKIKNYLNNTLSEFERNQFEQEMEQDIFLKEGVNGLELWLKDNPSTSIEQLEVQINEFINNLIRE